MALGKKKSVITMVAIQSFLVLLLLALFAFITFDTAQITFDKSVPTKGSSSKTDFSLVQFEPCALGTVSSQNTAFATNNSLNSTRTPDSPGIASNFHKTMFQTQSESKTITATYNPSIAYGTWPVHDVLYSPTPRDLTLYKHVIATGSSTYEVSENTVLCTDAQCICRDVQIEAFFEDPRITKTDIGPTATDMLCLSAVFPWNRVTWLATNAPELVYAIQAHYGQDVLPLGISGGIIWHMTGHGPRWFYLDLGYEQLGAGPFESLGSRGYLS
ncbi:hypothetical protein LTR37_013985 [Vermiconidia calcicola]|uniref:Uncharacterized protein n=1 Tax=Vermiconidia calcicola TaxID=1690605 RepID=A0ACC3MWC1_9PEZI|nr:hypothetical protein LTR37_013985 [Vermiconidia calcicola]